jgi:hypothetical protein
MIESTHQNMNMVSPSQLRNLFGGVPFTVVIQVRGGVALSRAIVKLSFRFHFPIKVCFSLHFIFLLYIFFPRPLQKYQVQSATGQILE